MVLLLAVAAPAPAQPSRDISGPVTVTALAVEQRETGFVGVHATVEATVLGNGQGRVFVSTKPLALTDMQGSARLAAQVAASTLGLDWRKQDYMVSFTSDSPVIGGPSAGAVMTLALIVALHNLVEPGSPWVVDSKVAATGTINPDGTIGPVGGVPAKAEGAKAAGIETFLYPAGLDVATTVTQGRFGLQQVQVDMRIHCRDLGIQCRSAARIEELVAAAAHVDLRLPDIQVPGTVDYARILAPSVKEQVDQLARRLDAFEPQGLSGNDQALVDAERGAAADHLEAARKALREDHYYLAATESFQGSINMGRAENYTAYVRAPRREAVIEAALASCESATTSALAVSNTTARTYSDLYAVGAAQQRAHEAANLLQQARASYRNALTLNDWLSSLATSVFCAERAATVHWWAGLSDRFGGTPWPQPAATAEQAASDAADLVAYAQAVTAGTASSALQRAQTKLAAAREAQASQRFPAAVVLATEAASAASVAMQSVAGRIAPDVLEAAQQGAARAIDQARSRGIEPILSVSLVELAQARTDPAESLEAYWTARSLALVDAGFAPGSRPVPSDWDYAGTYSGGTLVAFLVMGAILGLAGSGILVVLLMGRR
jgi:uncharacterized protein